MPSPWQQTSQGVLLHIHLQPRASRNCLAGLHGQGLKIQLTAPPVEGAANTALLQFLAGLLRLSRSSISLQSGKKSREKRVLIRTTDPEGLIVQLQEVLVRVDKKNGDG
jgi:uncharacterized protein (TIGR00251 family)